MEAKKKRDWSKPRSRPFFKKKLAITSTNINPVRIGWCVATSSSSFDELEPLWELHLSGSLEMSRKILDEGCTWNVVQSSCFEWISDWTLHLIIFKEKGE